MPTWIADSNNSNNQSAFDLSLKSDRSYIDEVEFAPNEEIKNLLMKRDQGLIPVLQWADSKLSFDQLSFMDHKM